MTDRQSTRRAFVFLVLLTLMLAIGGCSDSNSIAAMNVSGLSSIVQVKKGEFLVDIVEQAQIDALHSFRLSSSLPSNKAKVVYLAPEGEPIEKGGIVAKFDRTLFEEELEDIKGRIEDAEARLAQAEAELKLQQAQDNEKLQNQRLELQLKRLELQQIMLVKNPERREREHKNLKEAEKSYQKAQTEKLMQDSLLQKGLTQKETHARAIDYLAEQKSTFENKQMAFKRLEEVVLPNEIAEAQLKIQQQQNAYDSFVQTSKLMQDKAKASYQRAEALLRGLQHREDYIATMVENTVIYAPVDGLVLYQTLQFDQEKRKVEIGDSLWYRQIFVVIPDLNSLMAKTWVQEADVGKLEVGQAVVVEPEAYQDLQLKGTLKNIGALAADKSVGENLFQVSVALDDTDSRIRPGMSARASIRTQQLADVLTVPVQAVFFETDGPVAFVDQDGKAKRVPVQLGISDGERLVVSRGLSEKDRVMLVYPQNVEDGD